MKQDTYSMHPANSVTKALLPAPPVPQFDNEPQLLPPMSVQPVQLGTNQTQPQVIPAQPPLAMPAAPQAAAPQTSLDPVSQYYQQQVASYDNPWYKQHPIATRFLGMQQAGLPGLFAAPQIAEQMVQQNKAAAIKHFQEAQQQFATNQAHLGAYNKLATTAGLPEAGQNAVIGDKELGMVQALVQKFGAPALIKARDQFNQDTINYNRAQQTAATWNARKNAGLLTPEQVKAGPPVVPEAPVFNIDGINPYLDAGSAAGLTGTSGEAANTGQKSGEAAAEGAAKEKEANARLAELQEQLGFQKQSHEDSINLQKQTLQNHQSEFQQTQTQHQQDQAENTSSKMATRLASDAQNANANALKSLERVQNLNHQLQELVGKVPASKIRTDARYLKLNAEYRQAQEQYNSAKSEADKKRQRYESFSNPQQEQPVSQAPKPVAAPTGQTLHQAQPTMKIKIPRSLALKHKLI